LQAAPELSVLEVQAKGCSRYYIMLIPSMRKAGGKGQSPKVDGSG